MTWQEDGEGKLEHKSSDRCRIGSSSAESLGQIQKPGREFLAGRIGYKRLTCSAFGRLAPCATYLAPGYLALKCLLVIYCLALKLISCPEWALTCTLGDVLSHITELRLSQHLVLGSSIQSKTPDVGGQDEKILKTIVATPNVGQGLHS